MSVIEEAVQKIMVDDAGIGALAANRIYPQILPQGATLPAITWQRISGSHLEDLGGEDILAHPRLQINCWAATVSAASDLRDAVRAALVDYTGVVLAVVISHISLEDDGDLFEPSVSSKEERRFGRRLDFIVWHEE